MEDTQEIHIRNPNYKGKNYDPNYQARKAENKQQEQLTMTNNQYQAPATRPPANHNNDLARSSDIAGEVTLKTTVDGYQLLKMNELIKNAAAWRARMPKTSRFEKYCDNKETTKTTPKVQINSATLQVMEQTVKDCGYTKDEFIEAVEMYEHFGNMQGAFSSNYAGCFLPCLLVPALFGSRLHLLSEGCALVWGMFVRGCARRDLC